MDKKHVHKFRRHTYSTGNVVFFCALPDCNVKVKPQLTLGKRAICWRCGEEFLMDEYSIRLAKPHCLNCHKPKDQNLSKDKEEFKQTVVLPAVTDTVTELRNRMRQVSHQEDSEDI